MSTTGVIEQELNEIAGRLNAEHARLVDVTVELLADRTLWADWECRSLEHFVSWRTGVTLPMAKKIVAVAERVDDLPLCLAALREGVVSLDQVAPIARRVPWWADEEFSRRAQMMDVAQISRLASRYPFLTDIPKPDGTPDGLRRPESVEAEPEPVDDAQPESEPASDDDATPAPSSAATGPTPVQADSVWFFYDDQGRFRLAADVDAATGSIIENALTEARDGLFQAGDQSVTWTDALLEIAERSLGTIEQPARRTRFHTHVHREVDGAVTNATGCGVSDAVADYMTCDGLKSEVFIVDGIPVSVGRTQRIVPERTRRVVIHRDGGCRVPGCHDHRWLDVHHIVHWAKHGPTDTSNLIALCAKHHRMHHQHRLGITGNADDPNGVGFTNTHGQVIRASGARPKPPGERTATDQPAASYTPALRERLDDWSQIFNLPAGHRHRWSPYASANAAS